MILPNTAFLEATNLAQGDKSVTISNVLPAALSLCSIKSIKTHFYSAICRNESEAHVVICKNERLAQSTVSQLSKLFLPLCYEGFRVHLLEQPSQGNDLHLSVTVTLAVTYM